jgi:hypothetical protein
MLPGLKWNVPGSFSPGRFWFGSLLLPIERSFLYENGVERSPFLRAQKIIREEPGRNGGGCPPTRNSTPPCNRDIVRSVQTRELQSDHGRGHVGRTHESMSASGCAVRAGVLDTFFLAHMRMWEQPIDVPPNDFITGASSALELFAFEQLDLAPIGAQHAISLKLGRGL